MGIACRLREWFNPTVCGHIFIEMYSNEAVEIYECKDCAHTEVIYTEGVIDE